MIHFDMNLEYFKGKTGFDPIRNQECQDHNQGLLNKSRDEYLKNKEFNKGRVFFDDGTYNPICKIKLLRIPCIRNLK